MSYTTDFVIYSHNLILTEASTTPVIIPFVKLASGPDDLLGAADAANVLESDLAPWAPKVDEYIISGHGLNNGSATA